MRPETRELIDIIIVVGGVASSGIAWVILLMFGSCS